MPYLKYQDREIFSREGERVLDAMLRHGISIPFSCRNGVCHVCLQRCTQGVIPAAAQHGLSPELREHGCFMTCKCVPLTDMAFAPPTLPYTKTQAAGREMPDSGELLSAEHGGKQPAATLAKGDKAKYPPPDPELWTALREGELLTEVLTDFYTRVYQDARLASFFEGVTRQRLIEKQFLFTRQILTGEKIYFGDRPRNTHHWMVISDDLFDYRDEIMLTCLRKHGLPEPMIQRFREMEAFYRPDIVKSAPFARVMGEVELPFEGFGEITMDVGTLCDTCEREVAVGEKVIYHVRLGKIYCSDCSSQHEVSIINITV